MANLIVTVISIALVAVAALMGAYYGGNAFLDGQAKARANTATEELKQLAGAMQLYFYNSGVNYFPSGTYLTVFSLHLVPKYLSSVPYQSYYSTNGSPLAYNIDKVTGAFTYNMTSAPVNVVAVFMQTDALIARKTCQYFVESKGSSGGYYYRTPPAYTVAFNPSDLTTKQWFCVFADKNSNSTLDEGDDNFYLYYVFQ